MCPEFIYIEENSRRRVMLPASQRRWLTRQDVIAEYPHLKYDALTRIPPCVLPRIERGTAGNKSTVYDREDIDALCLKLKTSTLEELVAKAQGSAETRGRGRPRKVVVRRGCDTTSTSSQRQAPIPRTGGAL